MKVWTEDRLAKFRAATEELVTATGRVADLSAELAEAEADQRLAIKRLRAMMPRNRTGKDVQGDLFDPAAELADEASKEIEAAPLPLYRGETATTTTGAARLGDVTLTERAAAAGVSITPGADHRQANAELEDDGELTPSEKAAAARSRGQMVPMPGFERPGLPPDDAPEAVGNCAACGIATEAVDMETADDGARVCFVCYNRLKAGAAAEAAMDAKKNAPATKRRR